jgi:phenylacetate-CoA ligase
MSKMDYDPRVSARAAESGSREALVAYQAEQLQRTMKLVAASPYWSARFKETGFDPASITHPDELYAAPTLDKHQYAAALADSPQTYGGLMTMPIQTVNEAGSIIYRTTGTSGKQGNFLNTMEGFDVFSLQGHEMIKEAGGKPGDAILISWPLFFWAASWGFYHGCRMGPYLAVPGGAPADTRMRLDLIRQYRPSIIVATPNYAVTLGREARANDMVLSDFGVRGLLMGGETFGESKRKLIEELWGIPGGTRNFYGITEGGPLFAGECEYQDGLHLFEGDTIHQFWKPGTNGPAAPGEQAEHVFTSISQTAMATWFNFRTRDGATYTDEPCKCGRSTRRMWISERLDDMVKVKGINVFASGVEDLLAPMEGVGGEFKLVIDSVDSRDVLTLQVEVDPDRDTAAVNAGIRDAMTTAWGINFDVECLAPETLARTEGKARRWRDNRPKDD